MMIIADLWRAKRACGAPWVSKSTHPRKFGNHVTVHCPQPARPFAPQENQCSISHFIASLVAQEDWYCTHIVHQCCDQLTAVKTGYPLTSVTWPNRGLRCRPIEVEYLFVIRWQVSSLVFKWSQAQVSFFNSYQETIKGTEKASPYTPYSTGNSSRVTFKTIDSKGDETTANHIARMWFECGDIAICFVDENN